MRWLLLLAIAGSLNLCADVIGNTFTSTLCTAGTQIQTGASSCSISVSIDGTSYQVAAQASASANGLPWTIQFGTSPMVLQPPTPWTAQSQAKDYGSYATPGISRTGLIQFDISFGGEAELESVLASISDGVHSYDFTFFTGPIEPNCHFQFCEYTGELPILLGSGNLLAVTLEGSTQTGNCQGGDGCAPGGDATMNFSLFEANGTTTVPLSRVPEPTSLVILSLGLVGLAVFRFRRPRAHSRLS